MSRVPYKFTAIRTDDDDSGKNVIPYASVNAKDEAGAPANVYDASVGGSPYSSFILDANGSKQIWVDDPGIYQFSVAGGDYFSVFISSGTTEIFTADEKTKLSRALSTPAGEPASATLPNVAGRQARYAWFDAEGDLSAKTYQNVLSDVAGIANENDATKDSALAIVIAGAGRDSTAVRNVLNVDDGATANDTNAQLRDRATHTGTQSADTIVDGTTNKVFTAAEKTKLAGIQNNATANATNAELRDRATHTGTQAISTVTGLGAALDAKLDDSQLRTSLASPDNSSVPSTLAVASAIADSMAGETPRGAWDASANAPALASSVGTVGYWYEVSVAGTTNLNGETGWQVGDKAIFNGIIWTRIPANAVRSVDGRTGAVILNFDTPAQAALASLPVGAKYSTKGADAVGDGGNGDFIVETASGTPDGYGRILLANGNHAVLQPVNGYYRAAQFGEDFELAFAFSKFIKGTAGHTYNLSGELSSSGVDVGIDAPNSTFIVPEDTYLLKLYGGWANQQSVIATGTNTIQVADASAYLAEDVIKIVSDAALPINIDGGLKGEFCVIDEIDYGTDTLTLSKPLLWDYSADTGVEVHKLSNAKINVNIGSGKQSDVGAGTAELVYIEAVKNPKIYINRIEYANRGGGVAVSCYGGKFEIEYIDYSGIWYEPEMRQRGGYGLVPTNSESMTLRVGTSHRGRHVYDGTGDERGDLIPSRHGASAYNIFETCKSICGVDTDYAQHQGTYKNTFINPWSFGSGGFASFRGVGHRVIGGGAIGITGPFAGNIVGTTTPNTVTDDNELIGCILRGGNGVIASSSDTTSGKLKFTRCDMETNFSSSSTRVFTTAGTGISLRDCKVKVTGLISSGIFSVLSSVESIEMIGCELDLSDATLSSVRLINNQSGGASISSVLEFRLDGNTFITPAGFINLISDVNLPTAGSVIGDNKIRGTFTKISSNFTDSEMAPYVDGDVVYNREPLMTPSSGSIVTQSTSKATAVTLNKMCGRIVTNAANLAAGASVSFNLNNSRIGANDIIVCSRISGGTASTYNVIVDSVTAGQAVITIRNYSGSDRAEAVTLQFSVVRSAIA